MAKIGDSLVAIDTFRLGEQTPERQQTAILVRRVAMRMRSVQIEKVVDSLSVAA